MITYKLQASRTRTDVFVDGKKTGEIIPSASGGFRYRTKSGSLGEIFASIDEVKKSLEGGDA